jgi:hypothetical protein
MRKVTTYDLYAATELPSEQKGMVYSLFYHTIAGILFERMEDMLDMQLGSILERKYRDAD